MLSDVEKRNNLMLTPLTPVATLLAASGWFTLLKSESMDGDGVLDRIISEVLNS